jgi:hypothetical protein
MVRTLSRRISVPLPYLRSEHDQHAAPVVLITTWIAEPHERELWYGLTPCRHRGPTPRWAWRHARRIRLVGEIAALLPADAARAQLASQVLIVRELADHLSDRCDVPEATVEQATVEQATVEQATVDQSRCAG